MRGCLITFVLVQEWLQEDQDALLADVLHALQQVSSKCSASSFWPHSVAEALQQRKESGGLAEGVAGDWQATSTNYAFVNGSADQLCGSVFLSSVLETAGSPLAAELSVSAAAGSEQELTTASQSGPAEVLWEQLGGLLNTLAARLPAAWLVRSASRAASDSRQSRDSGEFCHSLASSPAEAHSRRQSGQTWLVAVARSQLAWWVHARDATSRAMERSACRAAAAVHGALPTPQVVVHRRSALRFRLTWLGLRLPRLQGHVPLELVLPSM